MQSVSIVFLVRFPSITKCTRYSLIEQGLLVTSLWEVTSIWLVRLWVRFSSGVLNLLYNKRFTYLQRSPMLFKKICCSVGDWVTGWPVLQPVRVSVTYPVDPLFIDMLLSERSTGHWYVSIWAFHWSLICCYLSGSLVIA